jgi:hypothetical protein
MVGTYRKYGRKDNCIKSFSQTILREETILRTSIEGSIILK